MGRLVQLRKCVVKNIVGLSKKKQKHIFDKNWHLTNSETGSKQVLCSYIVFILAVWISYKIISSDCWSQLQSSLGLQEVVVVVGFIG